MLYKPNFCCNCGEKIERKDWTVFTSRRFCGVCETDFKGVDYLPRVIGMMAVIVLILGVASLFQRDRKVLQTAGVGTAESRRLVSTGRTENDGAKQSSQAANSANQPQTSSQQEVTANPQPAVPSANSLQRPAVQKTSTEAVYYCGALTKKGTPCTRRVKTRGARCFQHQGQPSAADLR
ncbi:MAG TPA: hypothetical protein VGQ55_10280 [Pyrinomonadaceae bacterium]|nr:hypothetical protein [Pyrinomonadaceae bacterium]